MTTHIDSDFTDRLMQWAGASQTAGSGDPIALEQDIQDFIDTQWQDIGNFVTDMVDMPAEAEERGGTFSNPYDLMQHWLSSGLIGVDDQGNIVQSELINIYVEYGPDGEPYYSVWIGYDD